MLSLFLALRKYYNWDSAILDSNIHQLPEMYFTSSTLLSADCVIPETLFLGSFLPCL